MRLWTLHPRYLDTKGLVALWRESLLAQAVLRGRTRGYRHHPQLARFRAAPDPAGAVAAYLRTVYSEGVRRGLNLDHARIEGAGKSAPVLTTRGQLEYEWLHLMAKLRRRDPDRASFLSRVLRPRPHPLFRIVPGPVEAWERVLLKKDVDN